MWEVKKISDLIAIFWGLQTLALFANDARFFKI